MASLFSHGISAVAITKLSEAVSGHRFSRKFYWAAALSAIIPDADILSFEFGISYSHWLGHRGLTHSFFFAALWSVLVLFLFFRKESKDKPFLYFTVLFAVTASHGVLDAMTTGGRGIGFFIPFVNERYFLPWRFIQVSPLSAGAFFSEWGIKVLKSEAVFVMLPSILTILLCSIFRRSQQDR